MRALPPLNIGQEATALAFSQGGDLAIGDSTGLVHLWKEKDKSGSFAPWKQLGGINPGFAACNFHR